MRATQLRFLLFYSVTLLAVLLLFRWTTAYGEANLQAPPNINGRYVTTEPPPGCPADRRLMMTIQQSGIYLNGALTLVNATADTTSSTPEQLTFIGRWQPQLSLTGRTQALATCRLDDSALPATWKATIVPQPDGALANPIVGELLLEGMPPWQFTAQHQPIRSQSSSH